MKRIKSIFPGLMAALAVLTLAVPGMSQQPPPQQPASRFDVTHYRIEAQIIPEQHLLRAGADVTFTPLRSEEHTSELHHSQISYAVFCLKKKKKKAKTKNTIIKQMETKATQSSRRE